MRNWLATSTSLPRDVDVAVIGSGPAGAATALCLVRGGMRVVVLDRGGHRHPVGEVLSTSGRAVLRGLGLWEPFGHDGHLACHGNRSAWGGADLRERSFLVDPWGPAWHLDRGRFDAMVTTAAVAAGAQLDERARLLHATRTRRGWDLTVRHPSGTTSVRSRYVVDASGRAAVVARNLTERCRLDRMVAVVVRLRSQADDEDTRTLVEADAAGWWYSARLPHGRIVAIRFTDGDLLPAGAATGWGWSAALATAPHTRARLAGAAPAAGPSVVTAHSTATLPPAGDAWLAVGDAAMACDPLAAHGIAAALQSGQRAAAALLAEWDRDRGAVRAYGDHIVELWRRYRTERGAYYQMETRWLDEPFWQRRTPCPTPTTRMRTRR